MTFETLRKEITLQGNIKLALHDAAGNCLLELMSVGVEDINTCESSRLSYFDPQDVKYMYVGRDGFLHIEFEPEGDAV